MKIYKFLLVITLVIVELVACHKDDAARGIAGTWEGNWGFDAETPAVYEKWEVSKKGHIIAFNEEGHIIAEGSCELDGVNFGMEYTPTGADYSYSFIGLYNDALNEIIGTWGETPSASDRGTFEMAKK